MRSSCRSLSRSDQARTCLRTSSASPKCPSCLADEPTLAANIVGDARICKNKQVKPRFTTTSRVVTSIQKRILSDGPPGLPDSRQMSS